MNRLHYNRPQLRSHLIGAPEEIAIWGRGTGKSEGLIAPWTIKNVFLMPRSMGVYVASTYQQLITRTLPSVIKGFERLGYIEGRDFVYGHFAPKAWGWPKPYSPPLRAQHFFHWRNGTGIALVSQDRPGSANGLNIDWINGDEAKYLKKEAYEQELLPANRGNKDLLANPKRNISFGDLAEHHSILLCTDMPTNTDAEWLLEKEEVFNNDQSEERIRLIFHYQQQLQTLQKKLYTKELAESTRKKLRGSIHTLQMKINHIRLGDEDRDIPPLGYYSECSTLENIDALGKKYIDQMYRLLPWTKFMTSILGKRLNQVEDGFYPDLKQSHHGYDAFNNSFLDSQEIDFRNPKKMDCRQDGDCIQGKPLRIAADYGASFNCIVTGQLFEDEFRIIKSHGMKWPKKIRDVVREWKEYYQHKSEKTVYYYYDHTAKHEDADREYPYFQIIMEELRRADTFGSWTVIEKYIGQAPRHDSKYNFWSELLREEHPRMPALRYNIHNAEDWATSCMRAPASIGKRGFEKDKSSERKRVRGVKADQDKATHYSDAGDTLVYSVLQERISGQSGFAHTATS